MLSTRTLASVVLAAAACGLLMPSPPSAAQEDRDDDSARFEKHPPRRERPRDPQELQRRIEELRAADPNDPRIERLERMLNRLRWSDGARRAGRGDGDGHRGPERFDQERIDDFLKEHPALQEIFTDDAPGPRRRAMGRGALQEIMRAFDEEDEARGEMMIDSARNQFQTRRILQEYRAALRGHEAKHAAALKLQVEDLVRKQVRLDYQVKGLEIERLRERVERQTRKHQELGQQLEEVAQRHLQRLLEGSRRNQDRGRRGERSTDRDAGDDAAAEEAPIDGPPAGDN